MSIAIAIAVKSFVAVALMLPGAFAAEFLRRRMPPSRLKSILLTRWT